MSVSLNALEELYAQSLSQKDKEEKVLAAYGNPERPTASTTSNPTSDPYAPLTPDPVTHAQDFSHSYARKYGSFITSENFKKYADFVLKETSLLMGHGPYQNNMQSFLSRLDRHGSVITPLNTLNYGYTFITRPRLNLTGANLHQHPVLSTLYSSNENSVITMIRALLDTKLSRGISMNLGNVQDTSYTTPEATEFRENCAKSPLIDINNPFFVPLCNGLMGISGFPDFRMETDRNEGDFHNGNETWVKGSDMNNASTELSLEFRDVQGSIIMSTFYYWCLYMALQAKGQVVAYPDDIYEQRLNYTVSIYRFITDMTRENILWWAKATGCFPISVPIGGLFNMDQGSTFVESATKFSIPFACNKIEVNDPGILYDFNALVRRYEPTINSSVFTPVPINDSTQNFNSLPYIVSTPTQGLIMQWRTSDNYAFDDPENNNVDLTNKEEREETQSNLAMEVAAKRDADIAAAVAQFAQSYGGIMEEDQIAAREIPSRNRPVDGYSIPNTDYKNRLDKYAVNDTIKS